jgi:hypothetical protein
MRIVRVVRRPSRSRQRIRSLVAALLLAGSVPGQIVGPGAGKFFDPTVYYSLGMGQPVDCEGGAVFGDFNSDGFVDIAFGTSTGQLCVNLSMSPTTFAPPTLLVLPLTPSWTWTVALFGVGDFDLDGDIDIAGADPNGYRLFLNNGAGAFTALPGFVPFGGLNAYHEAVACFDVDGDGSQELVVGGWAAGGSQIAAMGYVASTGLMGLKSSVFVGATTTIWHLGGTDVDGDGAADAVAVVDDWSGPTNVYSLRVYGLVGGNFALKFTGLATALIGWPFIHGIFVGDVNSDGFGDVLVQQSITLSTFYGTASGTLVLGPVAAPGVLQSYPVSAANAAVFAQPTYRSTVADFDLDGVADILASGAYEAVVIRSPAVAPTLTATGTPYIPGAIYLSKHSHKAVDLDGDGDLDLIDVGQINGTALGFPQNGSWYAHYAIFWNRTIHKPACAPFVGAAPTLSIGTPTPGNANWTLSVSGAPPGAPVVFAMSKEPAQSSWGGCSLWLNLSPSKLLVPVGGFGYATANASGDASIAMSIPAATGPMVWLYNYRLYACAVAADPLGPLSIGGQTFASTETRGVLIW